MINTRRLRCVIGGLGMSLSIIVLVLSLINGLPFPGSISETYYLEPCIAPFMIILGWASGTLICYKGYELIDYIICSLAGIFGLGICLFPCYSWRDVDRIVGTFQLSVRTSDTIHMISAIAFFILLAFNSLFLFTKSSGEMTKNKKIRNIIFRVCGIGMVASFALLLFPIPHVIWWVETVALIFFGVSWLTKANCIPFLFADKK
jgi:hypothetical protein